jgi:hypothetical protein
MAVSAWITAGPSRDLNYMPHQVRRIVITFITNVPEVPRAVFGVFVSWHARWSQLLYDLAADADAATRGRLNEERIQPSALSDSAERAK